MSDEPAHLDPIIYEPVVHKGKRAGWKVPEHERERWGKVLHGPPPRPTTPDTRPLPELVDALGRYCAIDPGLEHALAAAHERDPARTTRAVWHVCENAKIGNIRNPGGLLAVRLRAIT